jgi:hypothetical protein
VIKAPESITSEPFASVVHEQAGQGSNVVEISHCTDYPADTV